MSRKPFHKFVLTTAVVFIVLLCSLPLFAGAEAAHNSTPVFIAVTDDVSLQAQRTVTVALQRLGYSNIIVSSMNINAAQASVLSDEHQILITGHAPAANLRQSNNKLAQTLEGPSYSVFGAIGTQLYVESWQQLSGMDIGTYADYSDYAAYLPAGAHITVFNSYEELYEGVRLGRVDAAVVRTEIPPGKIIDCGMLSAGAYSIYTSPTRTALGDELDVMLAEMLADGTTLAIKNNTYRATDRKKIVLHISSYSTDMRLERETIGGINAALSYSVPDARYYNYALNLKRSTNIKAEYKTVTDQIRTTFNTQSPDVVLVSDNEAFLYVKKNYSLLFEGVPIVFCGLNGYEENLGGSFENITGVVEPIMALETVDEIMRLFPNTDTIYIINDTSETGKVWKHEIREALLAYDSKVTFIYNRDLPLNEILNDVKRYGDNTVILSGYYYMSPDGHFYSEAVSSLILSHATQLPAFTLSGAQVGYGVLGGYASDREKIGKAAGELAVQIMFDVPVGFLPVIVNPEKTNSWVFDYSIAAAHNINVAKLPAGHIALNKRYTLREGNPVAFYAIIMAFISGTIVIAVLIYNYRRQAVARAKNEFLAMHDPLTGVGSRNAFEAVLADMLTHSTVGGAILLDLDGFQEINDLYGHQFGDNCLKVIADRLKNIKHDGVRLIARLGGDEFFVLAQSDENGIEALASKITDLLELPIDIDGEHLNMTASMGISMFPMHGQTLEDIMKNTDLAMYDAKALGKNQYRFYNPVLAVKLARRNAISNILRNCIANGEISVVYQPEISLIDETLTAFESLMRINSAQFGPIRPDEFIPIAESGGQILSLGIWVLKSACEFAQGLLEKGYNFERVAVNVSSIQLQSATFVQDVLDVVHAAGFDPVHLQLELTESILLSGTDGDRQKLFELRKHGIAIALDDFGTGYSSLRYLADLPVDTLKIDKSFIDAVQFDPKKRILAKLFIDLAHSLGMNVVAEGVEREEQKQFLKSLHCDIIQGYLYSPPLAPDKFSAYADGLNKRTRSSDGFGRS